MKTSMPECKYCKPNAPDSYMYDNWRNWSDEKSQVNLMWLSVDNLTKELTIKTLHGLEKARIPIKFCPFCGRRL